MELSEIRTSITALDQELLTLLAERRQLALEVARSKQETLHPVRDQVREQDLLVSLIQRARDLGLDAHYVTQLYHTILEDSVLSQQAYLQQQTNPGGEPQTLRIAFLGNKGSYSNLAGKKYFARYKVPLTELGCPGFKDIIETVESGQADYGVLPIENTSSGSINEVYDELQHTSLSIVGELTQPIEHCLLTTNAKDVSEIHTIYAHPQVHSQCSYFIRKLGAVKQEFCDSSSSAMRIVSELDDPGVAAMGSVTGGELYGLKPLERNLANQKENHTRFLVIARKPVTVAPQIPAKTTLILATGQKPGSLVEALLVLRDLDINMSKLESRPIIGNPWEEMFYVDLEANLASDAMQKALTELTRLCRFVKVLGCYPSEVVSPTQLPAAALAKTASEPVQPAEPQASSQAKARLSSRTHKQEDSLIQVDKISLGGDNFTTLIYPMGEQSQEQLSKSAKLIKQHGGAILGQQRPTHALLRGDDAQDWLHNLHQLGSSLDLPVMAEVSAKEQVSHAADQADILWVSAGQMHNLELLQEVGKTMRPVLLMRGTMASLDELLDSAEVILAQGNQQVILCEHGIRTFDNQGGTTLDLSAVALLRERTHLPVIVAIGELHLADEDRLPLIKAARDLGASGLLLALAGDSESGGLQPPTLSHLMGQVYQ